MTRQPTSETYSDCYEYHGNTVIERTRLRGAETLWRDWLVFDTIEEAADYFNAACTD